MVVMISPFVNAGGGNPYHDPATGKFTNAITSRASVTALANAEGILLGFEDMPDNTNGYFTLESGKPKIVLSNEMFTAKFIEEVKAGNTKWKLNNPEKPYAASNLLSDSTVGGYSNYKDYVTDHEIAHSRMFRYALKREYAPGKSSDDYCQGTKEWIETANKAIDEGWKSPTQYSSMNYGELYAECSVLHEYGYDEYLHKDIVGFIEIVNGEVKTYDEG